MDLQWINNIIELIKEDTINGLILIGILFFLAVIISFIAILTYRQNSFLQKVLNYIPFIEKEFVMIANFSKKEGKIKYIISEYLESGCKIFRLDTYKQFEEDGTITRENLEAVVKRQQETIKKAKKLMKNNNSFIYVGFPHVPLGFLDGINFTDIDDPILYEYQGMDSECLGKGFFELKRIYNTSLNLISDIYEKDKLSEEVALKIEQSFSIKDDDIKKIINVPYIIKYRPEEIGRCKITNYAQVDIYQREFEKLLGQLKSKGVERVHLFATTPVSLSFSLGRVVKHYHPEIIVYNYNNGKFDWGINLRNQRIIFPN